MIRPARRTDLRAAPSGGPPDRVRARGQSLPEFLIAAPLFLFLILLIIQLALVYRAKSVLDFATFEAARVGAVTGGDVNAMERAFVRGMTPLYSRTPGRVGVLDGWRRAWQDLSLLQNMNIEIVSPTQAALADFREQQYDGRFALPNDNLAYRPTNVGSSGVSVQDANILKIKVDYNFRLVVPFVDRVLRGDSRYVRSAGWFDPADIDLGLFGNRMPLQAQAVVRMHSPIYEEGSPLPGGP